MSSAARTTCAEASACRFAACRLDDRLGELPGVAERGTRDDTRRGGLRALQALAQALESGLANGSAAHGDCSVKGTLQV